MFGTVIKTITFVLLRNGQSGTDGNLKHVNENVISFKEHLPLKKRERDWVELTFAMASGTVARDGKMANSLSARPQ